MSLIEYKEIAGIGTSNSSGPTGVIARRGLNLEKPSWHPPWKLMRVISGHLGWVRSVAVEPGNEWFATGSADRTIKVSTILLFFFFFFTLLITSIKYIIIY